MCSLGYNQESGCLVIQAHERLLTTSLHMEAGVAHMVCVENRRVVPAGQGCHQCTQVVCGDTVVATVVTGAQFVLDDAQVGGEDLV